MPSQPPTNAPSSPPSAGGSPRRRRSPFRTTLIAFFWLGTAVLLAVVLNMRVGTVVAEWKQPNTVNYQGRDPYVIYVKDRSSLWSDAGRNRLCSIGVVSEASKDLRGAWTEYEFHNDKNDPNYFKSCSADWTADGVTVTEPTGHKLFIPKKAFVE